MQRALLLSLLLAGCPGPNNETPDAAPAIPDANIFQTVANDPSNTDGLSFATPEFDIAAGEEVQDCYFVAMPDLAAGQDYWVDHVRLGVNPGSHHMNVFRVKTIVNLNGAPGDVVHDGECFKSSNWADWPLVANSQQSTIGNNYFDWHLPTNVAARFSPGELLMVQIHYVNASTQDTPFKGKAVLDLYHSALTDPIELGTLFATEQSIRVCQSNPEVTYHGTCAFSTGGEHIAAANGHFHSRGKEFQVFTWDGTSTTNPPASDMFYDSLTWNEPPMTIYDPNDATKVIPQIGGIWWNCEYQWLPPSDADGGCAAVNAADKQMANDCCYTFGPKVETNEHCNVFLYYWPKVDRSDITCF